MPVMGEGWIRSPQPRANREEMHMPDIEIGRVPGGSAGLRGYLAVPEGDGPWPGVVAIHEGYGLNDMLRRHADRLAAADYLTIGPDLFSDGGAARCVVGTLRALFAGHGKPLADIDAARDHLAGDERCTGRIGVIGFCMGGGFALLSATRGFDVASANYAMLPRHIKAALTGTCPIVGSYGRKDPSLRGAANKLTRTLHELGVEHDVKEYPKAGHSFLNDSYYGPAPAQVLQRVINLGPEPEAAADAWRRIKTFFADYLT
jgi:carboxymethylenebutenolidase